MKKLTLNRETIQQLSDDSVDVQGGTIIIRTLVTCNVLRCTSVLTTTKTIGTSAVDACPSALGCTITGGTSVINPGTIVQR